MTLSERVEFTAGLLMQAAREAGMTVTGDGRISEADAEQLLGYSDRYLRQLRDAGNAPPHYRVNGRVSYRLVDLALWIELAREG